MKRNFAWTQKQPLFLWIRRKTQWHSAGSFKRFHTAARTYYLSPGMTTSSAFCRVALRNSSAERSNEARIVSVKKTTCIVGPTNWYAAKSPGIGRSIAAISAEVHSRFSMDTPSFHLSVFRWPAVRLPARSVACARRLLSPPRCFKRGQGCAAARDAGTLGRCARRRRAFTPVYHSGKG